MDWSAFHEKAKLALPPRELPERRYWLGVLHHDTLPEQPLGEHDFVWMAGNAKISIAKIHETYVKRHPDIDIDIVFEDRTPPPDVRVKSLNDYNDNIVVFRAMNKSRTPLHPVNRQSIVESRQSRAHDNVNPAPIAPLPSPALPSWTELQASPVTGGSSAPTSRHASLMPLPPVSANKENNPIPLSDALRERVRPLGNLPISGQGEDTTSRGSSKAETPAAPSIQAPSKAAVVKKEAAEAKEEAARVKDETIVLMKKEHVSLSPMAAAQARDVKAEQRSPRSSQSPVREKVEPFRPEDVFGRDVTPDADQDIEARPTDHFIQQVINDQNPELLEAGVRKSLQILDTLKVAFSKYAASSQDAVAWIKSMEKLSAQAERKRTVVGVVGNTGAGKSSVINAMLDEDRLLPTNCMRACTAVVTEISWNDSNDLTRKYRAEIEFISRTDWEKELGILMKEFLTENGTVAKETTDQDTDAGIAWAKFHAVYPRKTKEMLSECTLAELMAERSVLEVLGTTKRLNHRTAASLYEQLKRYIDSKEKVTGKKKDKEKDKNRIPYQMEYWPLIKVVKIYTKSPALSTGAVIVDLPGVHDSNAARAAVAQGYMKQCTGLWIVAPITRAVDDKAAKNLLGDSFKRQLKYDGGFSGITFICSKTDDISITEAMDSLGLNDQISALEDEENHYKDEVKKLHEQIEDLTESQEIYDLAFKEADKELDTWEALRDDFDADQTVYAPVKNGKKRKSQSSNKKSRKRRRNDSNDDSDDEFIASDDESSEGSDAESEVESDMEGIQAPQKPLTEEAIKAKINELRESKKKARRERAEIEQSKKNIKPKIRPTKARMAEVRAKMNAICISGRNNYSKTAIQKDFAAGIKDLDQENAIEDDEENFNPDEELRDYEEVANSLPVFCVSARAYQKMCGRMRKDDDVPCFETIEETEIPQLQAHCKKLTEAGRIQSCRTFLLHICQQLTTFSLWASNDGTGLQMTGDEKRKQVKYLTKRLNELEKGLEKAIQNCIGVMKKEMADQIFEKYPEIIEEAAQAAPDTARGWGAHRSEGGLFWGTYKALVRRDGIYTSASAGHRDFNAELVSPITKRLATGWERAFQHRLPKAFQVYTKDSGQILHEFHSRVEERARENGVGLASLTGLKAQIQNYEQQFQNLYTTLVTRMTELQRDANRDFTPAIVDIMRSVYELCVNERGTGSYLRMKTCMNQHVEQNRHSMFEKAVQTVTGHLHTMCKDLEEEMASKADEIYVFMKRDYMAVLGGVETDQDAVMSKEERVMRAEIKTLLLAVDGQFEAIAEGRIEEQVQDVDEDEDMDVEAGASDD
ncbi:hypothetical protein BDV95DRAFT_479698 [Massariosphaeria phaeospora]|uniref:Nuclear GTPase SLIP-GC n=1 Tax=Massariosphaeria phaeospora TaxID=100035 RepID=A0A7C8II45_9PLEO|nr:hypothetical protein BDV95DRAFT_479698 [Massariosphaeria phaeospora]